MKEAGILQDAGFLRTMRPLRLSARPDRYSTTSLPE